MIGISEIAIYLGLDSYKRVAPLIQVCVHVQYVLVRTECSVCSVCTGTFPVTYNTNKDWIVFLITTVWIISNLIGTVPSMFFNICASSLLTIRYGIQAFQYPFGIFRGVQYHIRPVGLLVGYQLFQHHKKKSLIVINYFILLKVNVAMNYLYQETVI